MRTMDSFTDADFKRTIWSALRLLAVITVGGGSAGLVEAGLAELRCCCWWGR